MKISAIILFGTIVITILLVFFFMGYGTIPIWLNFWWIHLAPLALCKMLLPNSKLSNWLNKEIWKPKN